MMHARELCAVLLCGSIAMGCGGSSSTPASATYRGAPGLATATMEVGQRKVTATADVSVTTDSTANIATVSMGDRKVKIDFETSAITVDGKEHAKLTPNAKLVEIRYVGGKLDFTVDGSALPAGKEARQSVGT
jgi:hypothetical protein